MSINEKGKKVTDRQTICRHCRTVINAKTIKLNKKLYKNYSPYGNIIRFKKKLMLFFYYLNIRI